MFPIPVEFSWTFRGLFRGVFVDFLKLDANGVDFFRGLFETGCKRRGLFSWTF